MGKQLSPVKTIQKELKQPLNKESLGWFGAAKFWKPFGEGSHFFGKATMQETLQRLKDKVEPIDARADKWHETEIRARAADTHSVLAKHAESSMVKAFHYAKAAVYADGIKSEFGVAAGCAFMALKIMRENGIPTITRNTGVYKPYAGSVELTVIAVKNFHLAIEAELARVKNLGAGHPARANVEAFASKYRHISNELQNRLLIGFQLELEELGKAPENYKKIAAIHGEIAKVLLYGRSNDELRKDVHSSDKTKEESESEQVRDAAHHFFMQSSLNCLALRRDKSIPTLTPVHEEAFNAACRARECRLILGESDHAALEMANLRDSFYAQGGRSIESPLYKYCTECNKSIQSILSDLRHEATSSKIPNGKKAELLSQVSNILRCDRETSSSEQHAFALIDESHAQEKVSNFKGAASTAKEALDILVWRRTNTHHITKSFESLLDTIVMLGERVENMKARA